MRKDTDIIFHRFGNGSIEILPIADVHYGAIEHNEAGWNKLCKDVLAKENVYLILAGDLKTTALKLP